jgi:serine/threonine protein kinase/uncharacterized protein YjdB
MEQRTASCPSCHRGAFPEDAFCSACGTRLQSRDRVAPGESRQSLARRTIPTGDRTTCGSCNNPILPGDFFCSTCGARYGAEPIDAGFGDAWASIPQRVTEGSGGKYEFVRELGRGGMGIVFMARDLELGRPVAIKVLSPSWLTDEAMVTRFQREARTIASLRQESIVSVYDVGRAGELHYFVMDFIEGVSLSTILRTQGPLPIPVVEAILYRVGLALSYAHRPERGIVHRDIKPSNIMLDPEGRAIVMDFGISKVSEAPSGLTRTGLVIGTPEYMSPEQCRGHTVTHESDQYSLGCVVYAMLTGAPPFTGPFYQVLMAHQTEPVPRILDIRRDCPPRLAAATERMLGKLPGDRWPDILDAIKALGLRPPAPDDPVVEEIGRLVRETAERTGSGGVGDDGGHTRRTPTSMRIMPRPDDLEVGDQVGLVATVLFPDGVEEPGREVTWESTDPTVARVDPSTGELVAVAPGSVLITAAGVGVREVVAVDVKPPQVVQIAIEPAEVQIEVGTSARLSARPRSKRGDVLERSITWSSSDPRRASVSADGVVTAKRNGTVSVLAHCEGVGTASVVRVVADRTGAPPSSPAGALDGGSAAGKSDARTQRILPDPPTPPVTRPETAQVPSHSAGSPTPPRSRVLIVGVPIAALVLAAGGYWLAHRSEPTPTVAAVRILTADGAAAADVLRVAPGDTLDLSAAASDAKGAVVDRPVSWSSGDPTVASIEAGGMLVGLARGTTRISASAGGVSREVTVTVRAEPAEVVLRAQGDSAAVSAIDLTVGQGIALGATVTDRRGRPLDDTPVAWRSSSASVASVDGNGQVTGRSVGQAVVSARAGEASREVRVSVTGRRPAPPASGHLVLRIVPSWAIVYVDGVSHGEHTGGLELRIAPGQHHLRLENPRMMPVDTVFDVQAGARVELDIRMRTR